MKMARKHKNDEFLVMPLRHRLSVVGMTYGAYHGPSNTPAGIPGVPMALAREDRLRPKGRLRQ
jgi:hypothetical protein